jgi:hypothetical protein
MRKVLIAAMCLGACLSLVSIGLAADTKNVDVKAYIPAQDGLTVTVSKVVGNSWTGVPSIDFGNLTYDTTNHIFVTADGSYYAVDVGVDSNAADWLVAHTVTSLVNGSENIDHNVNVTFMHQTSNTTGNKIGAVMSYAASNNKSFTKAQLAGGWLRVYYGIATGDTAKDGADVTPIGATQTNGSYTGRVTFTLTP